MNTELIRAASLGTLDEISRLLDSGADVNAGNIDITPLHAAIEHGHADCVQLLLREGASVEQGTKYTGTPLAHAVDVAIDGTMQSGGNPGDEPTTIIDMLIEAGANPLSGLSVAERYNSQKLINLLRGAMRRPQV